MLGSDQRTVILALVHGYSRIHLHPFVQSLEDAGYRGRLVFFHSGVGSDAIDHWRNLGIEVIPSGFQMSRVRESWRREWGVLRRLPLVLRRALFKELCPMAMFRYFVYRSFLMHESGVVERVMLTDARDVFFQRDPFALALGDGVHVFEEDRCQTLGTEPCNRRWMDRYFSRQTVEMLGREPILCSGTILGDFKPLVEFLKCFIDFATTVQQIGSPWDGIDQPVFNVLIRQSRCPPVRVHRNGDSAVLTAGIMVPERIRFDPDDRIVNDRGEVIPVVHQLDRHPALNQNLMRNLRRDRTWFCPARRERLVF
ncbi:MAG: hypothetical protein MUE94_03945 [Verrucomicrobia bacterium]|jgi:hypothetical protein|nr:hypothetical protein [Verrucomicrobiota bacterium]